MQTFVDFSESASFLDLKPIRRYYANRQALATSVFAEDMNKLHLFWRPAREQSFPWKNHK